VEDAELVTLRRLRDEGRITVFTDELELAPGIRLHRVGGHTPGQVMVSVDTADGRVLLASDAVHYLEELDDDLPFAFVADLPAMYRGFDRIHALVRDGDVEHVVPGHDPGTLARFRPLAVPNLEQDLAAIGAAVTEGTLA
jgi:glyoxylase-like metal-dependent hydrolase (beta-lactamase superfamily II)